MSTTKTDPQRGPAQKVTDGLRSRTALIVLLIGCLVLVGIGIRSQQALNQAKAAATAAKVVATRQAATIECLSEWAQRFSDTTRTRVDANTPLDRARKQHDDAVDDVFSVVILARENPPAATDKDFDAALARYHRALEKLQHVEARTTQTRARNPYPRLLC